MGSMAFRWSCRLPMLVKSALMRSRIEQNRRRLCVSEIPHRGLVPTTVDLYAIIDLVLWKTAWWFMGLLLCKKILMAFHKTMKVWICHVLPCCLPNYVWTMPLWACVSLFKLLK
jgi:hypothetical protein